MRIAITGSYRSPAIATRLYSFDGRKWLVFLPLRLWKKRGPHYAARIRLELGLGDLRHSCSGHSQAALLDCADSTLYSGL